MENRKVPMGDPHTQVIIIIITTINHKTMQMAVVLKNWNITKQQLFSTKTTTHLYASIQSSCNYFKIQGA